MASFAATEADLKLQIERLTGAIRQAKSDDSKPANYGQGGYSNTTSLSGIRRNTYVNPNYKPPSRDPTVAAYRQQPPRPPVADLSRRKDVVIGGVAFESSGRSLVRKDIVKTPAVAPKPLVTKPVTGTAPRLRHQYVPPSNGHRPYKPRAPLGRPARPTNRNMSLNNRHRPYQSRKLANRRLKYLDKPCPRFTTTGSCSRGLTCPYQHNPDKIAICWKFLQGTCPNSAQSCNLSHDPTPERTPLCVHFANNGRCTRDGCPFPHVRVGAREGVCRDFAVLGYCAKGLDCEHQHVRECPDFAEKGECTTHGCKLPHVIRANRGRKAPAATTTTANESATTSARTAPTANDSNPNNPMTSVASAPRYFAVDAKLGDEYISLTFHESEESDESEDGGESEEEEENGEGSGSDGERMTTDEHA